MQIGITKCSCRLEVVTEFKCLGHNMCYTKTLINFCNKEGIRYLESPTISTVISEKLKLTDDSSIRLSAYGGTNGEKGIFISYFNFAERNHGTKNISWMFSKGELVLSEEHLFLLGDRWSGYLGELLSNLTNIKI